MERVTLNVGAIRNKTSNSERYSSSHSKTHRAAMGFSVSFTGCVKRSKECCNETHTINASAPAAKTKRKPAGVSQGEREHLLPSEPDKADTQGHDAGAVVDHR
jgi:hypothetical protein